MTIPTTPNGKDNKTPLPAPANGAGTAARAPTAALPVDLAALSHEQIAALAVEAPRELQRRQQKVLDDLRDAAAALNTTPERLLASQRAKRPAAPVPVNPEDGRHFVKPLLWNPKDHSQRWSKRGAAPKWYVDHIAAGGTEAECMIPEGAA